LNYYSLFLFLADNRQELPSVDYTAMMPVEAENKLGLSSSDHTAIPVENETCNYVCTKTVLEEAIGNIDWDLEYQYFSRSTLNK